MCARAHPKSGRRKRTMKLRETALGGEPMKGERGRRKAASATTATHAKGTGQRPRDKGSRGCVARHQRPPPPQHTHTLFAPPANPAVSVLPLGFYTLIRCLPYPLPFLLLPNCLFAARFYPADVLSARSFAASSGLLRLPSPSTLLRFSSVSFTLLSVPFHTIPSSLTAAKIAARISVSESRPRRSPEGSRWLRVSRAPADLAAPLGISCGLRERRVARQRLPPPSLVIYSRA